MNNPASNARHSVSESGQAIRAALEVRLEDPAERRFAPSPIPDHELHHRIGSGAYGEVWFARNTLGTPRAVKIVYRDRFEDERPFQREFNGILRYEPVSRTHEGLIAVLHVGRNDQAGCFYYVMELADNVRQVSGRESAVRCSDVQKPSSAPGNEYKPRTLHAELALRPCLPPTEAAQLALRIARALEHLHLHGLVHRDIKPSNVIFIGGQPKLADIGLITAVGDSQSFVGTEGFIPPEGPGTAQADIYGLGKLLYEMATGRDRLEFPQLPSQLGNTPEADAVFELNEIITRACAPDPKQRYASATELVADLNLFLSGRSLRESRRLARHVTWLKRVAGVAFLVLLLVGLALAFAATQERHARERARVEASLRQRAEVAEQLAREQLYTALLEQARATVRSGEVGRRVRALEAVQRAATISNSVELRSVAMAALALPDLRFEREYAVSPDSRSFHLDPAFKRIASCQATGAVEILSASDLHRLATLPALTNSKAFTDVDWNADGTLLAVKRDYTGSGEVADLEVWQLADGPRRLLLMKDVAYGSSSFHPRVRHILVGGRNGEVVDWDLERGTAEQKSKLPNPAEFLTFSPDGDRFAASCERQGMWEVSIHTSANGSILATRSVREKVSCLAWDPHGDRVLATDHGGVVQLINPVTGDSHLLGRHKAQSVFGAFSPDGAYAITGGWERELICWNMTTLEQAFTIGLNSFSVVFQGDGRKCATVNDLALLIHSFELPICHELFGDDLGGRLRNAAFSPDGRWLAVSGKDKLGVWDLASRAPGAVVAEGADSRLFFAGDGRELFTSGNEVCFRYRLVPVSDPASAPGVERLDLKAPSNFTSLCLASNRLVLTASQKSWVLDAASASIAPIQSGSTVGGISGVSPDGRWLGIFLPYSTMLYIYQLPDLKLETVLTNRVSIHEFRFSPVNDEVVIASRKSLDFWKTANWEHTGSITNFMGMLFESRPACWWLTKDFQNAGLYTGRDLKPLLPLPPGTLPLAISRDGTQLAVSVDSRRVQVWNLPALRAHFRALGMDWNSEAD